MKIQKSKLVAFIEKYNLNGTNESVAFLFNSADSTLSAAIYAGDKTLVGQIVMAGVKSDKDRTVAVYETQVLLKLLSPLEDGELEVEFVESSDKTRIVKLIFTDGAGYKQGFTTSDISTIQAVPNLKKTPPFGIEVKIDKTFASKFNKFRSSQNNIESFTLLPDATKKIKLVMGFAENINTNTSDLPIKLEAGKDQLPKAIVFSAKHLGNILNCNADGFEKDDTELKLLVSETGLATITVEVGDFKSKYYITSISSR